MTNEYEQQAINFLDATGSTLKARYLRTAPHFSGDKEERDIWQIQLSKGTRTYIFEFGNSINAKNKLDILEREGIKARKKLIEWRDTTESFPHYPTTYNILACLDGYEPPENIDDFASDYGYDKPSEAIRTFEAVKNQYNNLVRLYSDAELEQLNEIN